MQFGLFLTHNILTSDDPSTDEETSTTDNILTSDYPSTDEKTSTTDEGDNTTTMYIHVFYKDTRSEMFYIYVNFCRYVVWYTRKYTYSNH